MIIAVPDSTKFCIQKERTYLRCTYVVFTQRIRDVNGVMVQTILTVKQPGNELTLYPDLPPTKAKQKRQHVNLLFNKGGVGLAVSSCLVWYLSNKHKPLAHYVGELPCCSKI